MHTEEVHLKPFCLPNYYAQQLTQWMYHLQILSLHTNIQQYMCMQICIYVNMYIHCVLVALRPKFKSIKIHYKSTNPYHFNHTNYCLFNIQCIIL